MRCWQKLSGCCSVDELASRFLTPGLEEYDMLHCEEKFGEDTVIEAEWRQDVENAKNTVLNLCKFCIVELIFAGYHRMTWGKENSLPAIALIIHVVVNVGVAYRLARKVRTSTCFSKYASGSLRSIQYATVLTILSITLLAVLVNHNTQPFLMESMPGLRMLRGPLQCTHLLRQECTGSRQPDRTNTQLLVLAYGYLMLLVLPGRQSMLGILSALLYLPVMLGLQVRFRTALNECIVLLTAAAIFAVSRYSMERAQSRLFRALAHNKTEAISEKVKRCEVEFQAEKIVLTEVKVQDAPEQEGSSAWCRSAVTAPACVQCHLKRDNAVGEICACGDCLPEHTLLHVQGSPLPKKLSDIDAGSQVLCYDRLMRVPHYVPITFVGEPEAAAGTRWVEIEFENGETLNVTEDHPIPCSDAGSTCKVVPARELQAGVQSMVRMTMQSNLVKSIAVLGESHTRSIACSVLSPERNDLLVDTGAKNAAQGGSLVAVGSADLQVTFMAGRPTCAASEPRQQMARSRSAPSVLYEEGIERTTPTVSDTSSIDCTLIIDKHADGSSSMSLSLAELLAMKAKMPSRGSVKHLHGKCSNHDICFFHNRFSNEAPDKVAQPCRHGALCSFCHGDHAFLVRKQGSRRKAQTHKDSSTLPKQRPLAL
eukprot:TRINITY_DN33057_c0_g1_i1.p1 TRINITY_DN33057_c0_g1~~TRINITY_DN33057_c0_g1_i1.p1  ORF type:complete len:652 (+),score=92.01 TRINITY_DN33057_c0_g1_i1:41-1996(+)